MIRVTSITEENTVTLNVEGELTTATMDPLKWELDQVGRGKVIHVDLAAVDHVDRHAIKFLYSLRARGIPLRNCQPYLSEALLRF
ncbi:hypothetical protein [Pelagicoccus sp. SDUM812002]|uniref:hypothetical protein n=1 Tax=Pelagicoccus sp. SDUM812002 TaxID=3041266 RepID=UPI00280CDEDB|nr:hypothetical protein [Pelagicoccus sp. SDUM812002]MDQ8184587.1 hypothetical protein [Pelagicoccus sp. SDUM812002]